MTTNLASHFIPRGLPLRRGYNGDEEDGVVKPPKPASFGDAAAVANGSAQQLVRTPASVPARVARASDAGFQRGADGGGALGVGGIGGAALGTAAAGAAMRQTPQTSSGVSFGGRGQPPSRVGLKAGWSPSPAGVALFAANTVQEALNTPTQDYAYRLNMTPGDPVKNIGIRMAGNVTDMANVASGGLLGNYAFADKRARLQVPLPDAQPQATQATQPAQPRDAAPSQTPLQEFVDPLEAAARQGEMDFLADAEKAGERAMFRARGTRTSPPQASAAASDKAPAPTPAAQQPDPVQQQMQRTAFDPKLVQEASKQTPQGFTMKENVPGVYQGVDANGRPVFTNIGADGNVTEASRVGIPANVGGVVGVSPAISRALSAARLQAAREGRFDDVAASYGGQPRGLPGGGAPSMPRLSDQERKMLMDAATNPGGDPRLEYKLRTNGRNMSGRMHRLGQEVKDRQSRAALQLLQLDGQAAQQQAAIAQAAQNAALTAAAQQPRGVQGVQQQPSGKDRIDALRATLMEQAAQGNGRALAVLQQLDGKGGGKGGEEWSLRDIDNSEGGKTPTLMPSAALLQRIAQETGQQPRFENGMFFILDGKGEKRFIQPGK